jgi:hypothetical protein
MRSHSLALPRYLLVFAAFVRRQVTPLGRKMLSLETGSMASKQGNHGTGLFRPA